MAATLEQPYDFRTWIPTFHHVQRQLQMKTTWKRREERLPSSGRKRRGSGNRATILQIFGALRRIGKQRGNFAGKTTNLYRKTGKLPSASAQETRYKKSEAQGMLPCTLSQ